MICPYSGRVDGGGLRYSFCQGFGYSQRLKANGSIEIIRQFRIVGTTKDGSGRSFGFGQAVGGQCLSWIEDLPDYVEIKGRGLTPLIVIIGGRYKNQAGGGCCFVPLPRTIEEHLGIKPDITLNLEGPLATA